MHMYINLTPQKMGGGKWSEEFVQEGVLNVKMVQEF